MGGRARGPRLFGRDAELARLDAEFSHVLEGEGRTLLLLGDAGIGKTSLATAFIERVEPGAAVLVGGCVELGDAGLPYGPFAEGLRTVVRSGALDAARLPAGVRAELALLVPSLAPATGLPVRGSDEAELGRIRLFEAVLAALEHLARARPVVVVAEDLHWADRSTLDLFAFLVRNLADARVLLIATARPDVLLPGDRTASTLLEVARRAAVTRLELGPLSVEATQSLIERIAGRPVTVAVAEHIHRRGDGNPYYVEELVASGPDLDRPPADGSAALGAEWDVPPSLRDILLTRLARLSPAAQAVAGAAAIVGRVADEELIERVARLDPASFVAGLREVVRLHVLEPVRASAGRRRGSGSFAFRHALMQEAAYRDLLPGERRTGHRRAAAALLRIPPTGDPGDDVAGHAVAGALADQPGTSAERADLAATVAFHLDRAGEPAALEAALVAARTAEAVSAYGDAHHWYMRALELHDGGIPWPDGTQEADIATAAAQTAEIGGDARRAVDLAQRAIAATDPEDLGRLARLAERLAEHLWSSGSPVVVEWLEDILARLPADRPSLERALVHFGLGNAAYFAGDRHRSLELFGASAQDAGAVGAVAEQAYALSMCAFLAGPAGHAELSVRYAREATELIDDSVPPFRRIAIESSVVAALSFVGRHDEAIELGWRAARAARDGGYDRSAGGVLLANATDSLIALGRPAEALSMSEVVRVGDGSPYIEMAWHAARLRALVNLGRVADADDHLRQLAMLEVDDNDVVQRALLHPRLEIAVLRGHPEAARADVDRLFEIRAREPTGLEYDRLFATLIVRGEADLGERARAMRDSKGLAEARERARRAAAIIDDPAVRVLAGSVPDAALDIRYVALELERLEGRPVADAWLGLADDADRHRLLPVAILARIRAAADLLASGAARADARRPLELAHAAAAESGLALLAAMAEGLAARGRLELRGDGSVRVGDRRDDPGRAADPYRLTDREREILALVAAGYTNRQIGEQLYISPKTAGVHVSNILAKLDVAGRVEAALVAHRLGISAAPELRAARDEGA